MAHRPPVLGGGTGIIPCALRSDDTEASFGVASGRLAVGSGLMLPHLCADERLLPPARERVLGTIPSIHTLHVWYS